jgi:hypothetical protein
MNISTKARTVAALATVAVTLAITPSGPASATRGGTHRQQDVCRLAVRYLPQTPDAVEGWLRHCPR